MKIMSVKKGQRKNDCEEIVIRRPDEVVNNGRLYKLTEIPSGVPFSRKKNEENYGETILEDMNRTSTKKGTESQAVFYAINTDRFGDEMKGILINKKSPGASKTFLGSAEYIREQAYNFFMKLSATPKRRNDWSLLLIEADDLNPDYEQFIG